jgi:hypothetical protein
METFLLFGRLSGFVGILVFLVASIWRLTGRYFLSTFQVGTLLQVSIAAMILGCFCLLLVQTGRKAD